MKKRVLPLVLLAALLLTACRSVSPLVGVWQGTWYSEELQGDVILVCVDIQITHLLLFALVFLIWKLKCVQPVLHRSFAHAVQNAGRFACPSARNFAE